MLAFQAHAQEADETPTEANIRNGNLFLSLNDCEVSQWYFQQALSVEPGNAEALIGNGRALACRYNYTRAIESFRSAIEADASQTMAYVHLALALQSQQLNDPARFPANLGEALAVLEQAERAAPGSTQVLNTKGVILFQLGELTQAREALEHAVQSAQADEDISDRMQSVIHVNLGKTYRDLNNFDLALTSFRRAIVLDPSSASAHSNLGNAMFQTGDCAGAEFELEQAAAIDPTSLSAVSDLAITLFECGKVAESVPRFEQAIDLDGSIFLPPLYTYQARGLIELGRYEEAVFRASQASRLDPVTADAQYYLGRAYCARGAVGDSGLAAEAFQAAVAIDPLHEGAQEGVAAGCRP